MENMKFPVWVSKIGLRVAENLGLPIESVLKIQMYVVAEYKAMKGKKGKLPEGTLVGEDEEKASAMFLVSTIHRVLTAEAKMLNDYREQGVEVGKLTEEEYCLAVLNYMKTE